MIPPRYIIQALALYDTRLELGQNPGRALYSTVIGLAHHLGLTREQGRALLEPYLMARNGRGTIDTGVL